MDSPDDKPVLDYRPPAAEPQGATRSTRIVAAVAAVSLGAVAVWLWRVRAQDSSMAALAGAVLCLIIALGLVKDKRR